MLRYFLFLICIQVGYAQSLVRTFQFVTLDGAFKPVSQGTIQWWTSEDSLHPQRIELTNGRFKLELKASSLLTIRMQHAGFAPFQKIIQLDTVHQQPTVLKLSERALQEVQVKAKRETFQIESDRITIQVEGSPLLSGGALMDILDKTPRVHIDPQTKSITIDSKPGAQVYLNNRQILLTSEQLAKYLQSLPAGTIERIEILTNPPARYDASGGGVILIYTRKSNQDGLITDVLIAPGLGRFAKLNSSINVSWRKKNLSFYALYTPQVKKTYYSYLVNQVFTQASIPGQTNGNQYRTVETAQHGLRLGGELALGSGLQGGFNLYGFISWDSTATQSQTVLSLLNAGADHVDASSGLTTRLRSGLANLYLIKPLEAWKGRLSADFDVANYRDDASSTAKYSRQQEPGVVNSLSSFFPVSILINSAKVDLESKPVKNLSIDAGVKYAVSSIGATPLLGSYTSVFSPLISNLVKPFSYHERIAAIYGNAAGSFKSFSWQAGLRFEWSSITIKTSDLDKQRFYSNLFPSITIQKLLPNKAQLKLAFSQRITRPNFTLLNPAYVFLDPFTISAGNPLLTPQFNTSLQLSFQLPSRSLWSLQLTQNINRITEVVARQDSLSPILYNTNINFDQERRLAATYSFPIQLTKAWRTQLSLSGTLIHYSTLTTNVPFAKTASAFSYSNSHSFLLGRNWTAEVQFIGRTATLLGFMYYKPLFVANLGFGRSLWNKKGSLKFSASDAFHLVRLTNYGQYGFTHVEFQHRYESQVFSLSLSYRFGNPQQKRFDPHTTASETEQERTQK